MQRTSIYGITNLKNQRFITLVFVSKNSLTVQRKNNFLKKAMPSSHNILQGENKEQTG